MRRFDFTLDVSEEGFDNWDVWVLGRRMEVFSVFRVKLNTCGQEELSGWKERVIKSACVGG